MKIDNFLPYLVKNAFFGSNYLMKDLNFMFYMSYWSLSNFLPNDTMFDRWFGCFVLILGQKHCFLGQKHWFWDNMCYFWVYTYSINKQICFLYFPNFLTQFTILFITTYRKFEISSTWDFKIRLTYINFGENWHFLPYLVKKLIFWV